MLDPLLEMRRLAGKVAFLLAAFYLFSIYGGIIAFATGRPLPILKYVILLLLAAVFAPSVIAGIRLHQTTDRDQTKRLWRRSLSLAVLGAVILFANLLIE